MGAASPRSELSTSSRLRRQALLLVASRMGSAGVLLLLTPYLVARIGRAEFGVWVLAVATIGMFSLVDFGAAAATGRLVAHAAASDRARIASVVTTGLVLRTAQALLIGAVAWALVPPVASNLSVPAELEPDVVLVLRLALVTGMLANLAGVFNGALVGLGRIRTLAVVSFAGPALFGTAAVVVLLSGGNVVGLMVTQLASQALTLAALSVAARRAHGERLLVASGWKRDVVRELFQFGLPRQLSWIAFVGAMQYERLLIGVLVGATAAAAYGPAGLLVGGLAGLISPAIMPLMPALTRLAVVEGREALSEAYARAVRQLAVLWAAAFGALAAVATPLVAAWVGPGFGSTPRYIQILATGFLLRAIAEVGFAAAQADRRPKLEGLAAVVTIAVTGIGSPILVGTLGTPGAAVGTAAGLAAGSLTFFALVAASDASGLGRATRGLVPPCATAAVLAVPVAAFNSIALGTANLSRLESGALAACEAGVFLAAYALVIRASGYMPTARSRPAPAAGARASGHPRVALISPQGTDSTAWLASALAASDAEVHLMVPADKAGYLGPDLDSRVQIASFPFSGFYRPLRQARECWELTQRVRGLDPDVVHLQQGHHLLNLMLGRLRRYPLVVTIHEPSEHHRPRHGPRRPPQFVLTLGFRRANGVIIHGEALRSAVVARGVDPAAIHTIPRPVPRSSGAVDGENSPTVLFFGRIWPYKGLEYLIRAEPLIAATVPTVKTVIAGVGEDLRRYRDLMSNPERFDIQNHFVSREQRSELFARASVVVLPYVDASTSAVIPLAYLHQKPVVVTSVGGLADDVDAGRTGLVVPPRDPVALAEAVSRILRDDGLRDELGRAGRRKLVMECARDLVARRTLHVYALAQAAAATSARRLGRGGAWWPGHGGPHRAREDQNL